MPTIDSNLYEKVIHVTRIYLGPAADRFIARQVRNHLKKPPECLSRDDLRSLIDWIRIAMSLLTEDGEIIEEYASQLERLTRPAKLKQTKL